MNRSPLIAAALGLALAIALPMARFAIAQEPETASQKTGGRGDQGAPAQITNAKLRTWTDGSGKYKLKATLVQIDSDKAVLRRDDREEIRVPLLKLSEADRQYIADIATGKNPSDDVGTTSTDAAGDADISSSVTDYEVDYRLAPEIDLESIGTWKYKPDAAAEREKIAPASVEINFGGTDAPEAKGIFFSPKEKLAFVVIPKSKWEAGKEATSTTIVCDLEHGKVVGDIAGVGEEPVDVAGDGSLLLSRTSEGGTSGAAELRLYAREKGRLNRISVWKPYETGSRMGEKSNVAWARFTDSSHVLTMSENGVTVLWEVPAIKPVFTLVAGGKFAWAGRATKPGISPDGKYAALATKEGIALVSLNDAKAVGLIRTDEDIEPYEQIFAFSDDGQKLATWESGGIRVWELGHGRLVRDMGLEELQGSSVSPHRAMGSAASIAWAGNNHLVLGGRVVVDVDKRVVVWDYTNIGDAYRVLQGQLWFISSGGAGKLLLAGTWVPNQQAIDIVANYTADQLLVLHPDMEVSVEVQGAGDAQAALKALGQQLEQNGMKVVDQAKLRLIGNIEQAPTVQLKVMDHTASGGAQPKDVAWTPTRMKLSFVLDGKEIWKYTSQAFVPPTIYLRQGETVEQAVQRYTLDAKSLIGVKLPRYLARLPDEAKKGS